MKKILFILMMILGVLPVCAQFQNPVQFTVKQNQISDSEIEVVFTGKVAAGWHVYSTDIPDDGPTKAELTLEKQKGVKPKGKLTPRGTVHRAMDDIFGMELSYMEGTAVFAQKFTITEETYEVQGYLTYGACNDQNCMPPTSVDFSYTGTGKPEKAAEPKAESKEKVTTTPAKEEKKPEVKEEKKEESKMLTSENLIEEEVRKDAGADDSGQDAVVEAFVGELLTDVTSDAEADTVADAQDSTATAAVVAPVSKGDLWTPVVDELKNFGEDAASSASDGLLSIFLLGLLGGLVALFTPCVWPIIPMTVSFFLKRNKDSKAKGIRDAVTYGISIVVIYVLLGMFVTLVWGANALNALSTSAGFNIFFFLMLVTFGASFLGGFEISLPSKFSNAVDRKSESTTGLLSIFLMAFTLCLVSFSCTGPIIGFLLVEVSTMGSILAPTVGMLGFAIALALPFALFAMFPTWLKSAPKSGNWMNCIKVCLGFLELAFSLKFLSVADLAYGWHILDREVFLSLWIVLFALAGAYLIGWIRFPHDEDEYDEMGEVIVNHRTSVVRFFLAVCSFAFAMYMVPGLWGAPCKAVSAFAPPMNTQDFNLDKENGAAHFTDYEEGMAYARQHKMPVLVDFTGYGCVNCRKMEAAVWTNPQVKALMDEKYVLISLYVDEKAALPQTQEVTVNGKQVKLRTVGDKWSYLQNSKFGANAQPFYVLLDNEGHPLNKSYSYDEDIPAYVDFLETGLKNYKNR